MSSTSPALAEAKRIFVNSRSDLFHEGVALDLLHRVFATMQPANCHTLQILTKRADRVRGCV
jgi:protein gp37